MASKELRRLKRRELLKMLLVQCEESERLQEELDEITERFDAMSESYERLKKKLDVKDERLNQKDAAIAELKAELEKIKGSGESEEEGALSMADAAARLNRMFEEAEAAAAQHLERVRRLKEGVQRKLPEKDQVLPAAGGEKDWIPFGGKKRSESREKTEPARIGELVSVNFGQRQAESRQTEKAQAEKDRTEKVRAEQSKAAGSQEEAASEEVVLEEPIAAAGGLNG